MPCRSCSSENLHKFTAEIALHFHGLKNLDKPHVYVSPELAVCLDCGVAQFAIQDAELRVLGEGDPHVGKTPRRAAVTR